MPTNPRVTLAGVLVAGLLLTFFVLQSGPGGPGQVEEPEAASYPRGPHGGRLLSDGPLQLEITIYEEGVPPSSASTRLTAPWFRSIRPWSMPRSP